MCLKLNKHFTKLISIYVQLEECNQIITVLNMGNNFVNINFERKYGFMTILNRREEKTETWCTKLSTHNQTLGKRKRTINVIIVVLKEKNCVRRTIGLDPHQIVPHQRKFSQDGPICHTENDI